MRTDGAVTYFQIEHEEDWRDRWATSALEHLLFNNLTEKESRSHYGNRYRRLLSPQSASSEIWQKYGINGFIDLVDARKMIAALRARNPDMKFRIVKRTQTQFTEVVVEQ